MSNLLDCSPLDADFPVATVMLGFRRGYWQWVVNRCPLRGCKTHSHIHGGGFISEDPRGMLGHRAHFDSLGYLLVDGSPRQSAELIKTVCHRLQAYAIGDPVLLPHNLPPARVAEWLRGQKPC